MSLPISLANLVPAQKRTLTIRLLVKVLDRVLGIRQMNTIYQQEKLAGLDKEQFAQKLLEVMNISLHGAEQMLARIPKEGPVVIASNHPFGGIEGVILCLLIGQLRPDLKVLANQGLKLFKELNDYFIFTNPLSEKDPKNGPSIRAALKHVKAGNALLIFPAGRVSYYRPEKGRVSEHEWNRVVARLINRAKAHYVPVFVAGENSPLFYRLGRIYYRLRMLMLARELLNKRNAQIDLQAGTAVKAGQFDSDQSLDTQAQMCRLMSYAQDPKWRRTWPVDKVTEMHPLAEEAKPEVIAAEIAALPDEQHLLDYKDFAVYFGYQSQLPATVDEIARLREKVFRDHNEGSGEPLDTDHFDATYTHLFVLKRSENKIIGAYRMGRSDVLLKDGDLQNLYLSRMFKFEPGFVNRTSACLEMGRSFLIPEYQRSFQGLYLLWRGIGAFVCKFPHYRTLYGTVSLSKLYDTRSVALIQKALVTPTDLVKPYAEFDFDVHPEIADFAQHTALTPHLSALLGSIEQDGKDIPVLAKHYMKLGAKFHCLGIDRNFNDTPGLLLSVDLPAAPDKLLKLYLSEGWKDYQSWQP